MPDIQMCRSTICYSARHCRRHRNSGTMPSLYQAYGEYEPDHTDQCGSFWPAQDDEEDDDA